MDMKNLSLFLILFTLISCGMKETVVSNIDTIVYYKAQSKLDLYSTQKEALKVDIKKFLNGQTARVEDTRQTIKSIDLHKKDDLKIPFRELVFQYKEIATEFAFVVAKPMSVLDQKQQTHLFKELEKENQEMVEKLDEKDSKEYFKRFRFFFGSITPKQEELILSNHDFFKSQTKRRLEKRRGIQAEIKEVYKTAKNQKEKEDKFYKILKTHLAGSFENEDKILEFIQKVVPTLDEKQIKYFNDKKSETLEMINLFANQKY